MQMVSEGYTRDIPKNVLLTSILQRILIKQLQTYPLKKRFFEVTDIGKQSLAC